MGERHVLHRPSTPPPRSRPPQSSLTVSAPAALVARPAARAAVRIVAVRAEELEAAAPATPSVSEAVAAAEAEMDATPAPAAPAAPVIKNALIGDKGDKNAGGVFGAMSFNGAPELINGRLAMVAVTAAVAAELSSGESVLRQFAEARPEVLALVGLISVASIVPWVKNAEPVTLGPFSPDAEVWNGRVAMLGLAFLMAMEANLHGRALL